MEDAKKCFEGTLQQDENNLTAIRYLSMVTRMEQHDTEEARQIAYEKSIKLANQAVMKNLSDAESWYVLGNAYLTNFF